MHVGLSDSLLVPAAIDQWIQARTIHGNSRICYVKPRTLDGFEQYKRALLRFFGHLRLREIHVGHLREYQQLRAAGKLGNPEYEAKHGVEEVGPHRINQELALLVRVMKRAHAWTGELEEFYEPLQVIEADVPRALTPQEQEYFLNIAASRQEWQTVYCYAIMALNTTASGCEMRGIKRGDLNVHEGFLLIRNVHAKNKYRVRTIPLSDDARWAAQRLLELSAAKGARDVAHYLFPLCVGYEEWDPSRPMSPSGIKKQWDAVRKAANLGWFRPHDTRHTAITRMAEAGVPLAVIMSMAGHISRRMTEHYTQISVHSQKAAIAAAFGKRPGRSFQHPPTFAVNH
jgi:integrase